MMASGVFYDEGRALFGYAVQSPSGGTIRIISGDSQKLMRFLKANLAGQINLDELAGYAPQIFPEDVSLRPMGKSMVDAFVRYLRQ